MYTCRQSEAGIRERGILVDAVLLERWNDEHECLRCNMKEFI